MDFSNSAISSNVHCGSEERLMNKGLEALTTPEEMKEVQIVGKQVVKLKRTFNQEMYGDDLKVIGHMKFWQVIGPANHPNLHSDLSLDGLKRWGIIK
jgi:hypothetical protein